MAGICPAMGCSRSDLQLKLLTAVTPPLPVKTNYSFLHRSTIFAYGIASYLVTLVTFAYLAGFIGNFLVPTSLDASATGSFWKALLINLGLIVIFSVQHSVMARPAFKSWWTRYVPAPAERST